MDLVSRRTVLRFVLAATVSVLSSFLNGAMAQEPAAEAAVPPTVTPPWACDWSVTCTDANGDPVTHTGTEYGVTADKAEKNAENASDDAALNCGSAPEIFVGAAYRTFGVKNADEREKARLSSPEKSASDAEWVVRYECTGRKGGKVAKESRGATYCEALNKARTYVCTRINSEVYGGACRCCSRIIERPVCCPCCVSRKGH